MGKGLGQRFREQLFRGWGLGGLSVEELLRRVWEQVNEDEVGPRAAQLAYYLFFSLFPLLLVISAITGLIARGNPELQGEIYAALAEVSPGPEALELIRSTVSDLTLGSSPFKITLGLLAASWAASNGVAAMVQGLDAAYGVEKGRPFWRRRLVALGLTVGLALLVPASLAMMVYGEQGALALASSLELGVVASALIQTFRWVPLAILATVAFELLYNFAPKVRRRRIRWFTPGGAAAVFLWLLASYGLQLYFQLFGGTGTRYYGSLGAVIALMLWFYLSGFALLVGGEVNSEILEAEAASGDGADEEEEVAEEGEGAGEDGAPEGGAGNGVSAGRPAPS